MNRRPDKHKRRGTSHGNPRAKATKKDVPPDYDFSKSKNHKKKPEKSEKFETTNDIRLNKFIANAGVCSRREADQLILAGRIKINDNVVKELGTKVKPGEKVYFDNKLLRPEKFVYVLLNKPKDFITTTSDPNERKTVMQLVANACEERVYPVGRLDRNTTGLLLFTNDGDLSKKLTHPSHNVKKVYQVELNKSLEKADYEKIAQGIELEDGPAPVDDLVMLTPDNKQLGIELHLGKNRIVRRIFEALGYDVVKLDRVMFAGLTKRELARGKWRYLTQKEVIQLKFLR